MPTRLAAEKKAAENARIKHLERQHTEASDTAPARDEDESEYLNPQKQDEILNPKPMGPFLLTFDDEHLPKAERRVSREIFIPTAFTPNMVNRRRIMDELEFMATSIMLNLQERIPASAFAAGDWFSKPEYAPIIGLCASAPDIRDMCRKVVAKLTGEPLVDIEDGLASGDVASISISLMILTFSLMSKNATRGKTAPA